MFKQSLVWGENEDGHQTYHVPGVMVTRRGTVLAWADTRNAPDDFSPRHLVLKRSVDGGETFTSNQYLGRSDDREIFLFANAIQSRGADRIHFLYAQKAPDDIHRQAFIWHRISDDEGQTWSAPTRIEHPLIDADAALARAIQNGTAGPEFRGEDATLYGRHVFLTGPGMAIQLRDANPKAPDRLVVPMLAINDRNHPDHDRRGQGGATLISDDGGMTWRAGGILPIGDVTVTEPSIIELADGALLMNARIGQDTRRAIATSGDGGMTWTRPRRDNTGIPPFFETHAGLVRLNHPEYDPEGVGRILFSFPNCATTRENLTILMSTDEHASWSTSHVLDPGPSYYSNMAVHDGTVYLIYGRGGGDRYFPTETALIRFNHRFLTADDNETSRPPRQPSPRRPR